MEITSSLKSLFHESANRAFTAASSSLPSCPHWWLRASSIVWASWFGVIGYGLRGFQLERASILHLVFASSGFGSEARRMSANSNGSLGGACLS